MGLIKSKMYIWMVFLEFKALFYVVNLTVAPEIVTDFWKNGLCQRTYQIFSQEFRDLAEEMESGRSLRRAGNLMLLNKWPLANKALLSNEKCGYR